MEQTTDAHIQQIVIDVLYVEELWVLIDIINSLIEKPQSFNQKI
jgi:hypothetical protein